MANRIDVQSHFLPPDYLAALRNAGIRDVDGYPLPQWTVDSGLAAMDQNGIGAAVLSVSSPALHFVDGDAARELARSVNESARALITAHPDRFGAFALLPLPDVDASLREIAHALDTLGLDGVGVLTNYAGAYLGDRRFAPLFDELQRRKAVVFIHPTQPPGFARLSLGLPAPVLEYPFDSTRAINSLILSGTLSRCPDIRFIVSHGGGTIPYLAPRFAPFMAAKPGEPPDLVGPGSKEVMEMLRRLYFDLTASTHHGALSAMLQLMPPSQLLLGFDFPFMPPATIAPVIASLESFEGLSSDDQQAIASGSARRLLPKVGAR